MKALNSLASEFSLSVSDSVVDPRAMTFADGPFGTGINGQTFQQEALISCGGWQYATYFGEGGQVCVARRQLTTGVWQTLRLGDYTMRDHRDAHNVVSMGICEADGTIHLAFDHHCDTLHYRRSRPGLTQRPHEFEWTAAQFGPVGDCLEEGRPLQKLTYPQFFAAPDGRLQLLYRLGASGDGDWYITEYDGGKWRAAGMLLSRLGTYQHSPSRCAYPNPPRYSSDGRLHMSWCWRERPAGGPYDLRTNHDLCYAWSDDQGRTWKDNGGRTVCDLAGKTGPMGLDTPGIIVRQTKWLWGQMNTTTQTVDAKGRVHVINWQQAQDATEGSKDLNTWRYYHYWRGTDGTWQTNELPFRGRKPQIIVDGAGTAYVIFCKGENANYHGEDAGGHLTVMAAGEQSGWTDWQTLWSSSRRSIGEPLLDQPRWNAEGVVSVYLQDKAAKAGEGSALRVYDFCRG